MQRRHLVSGFGVVALFGGLALIACQEDKGSGDSGNDTGGSSGTAGVGGAGAVAGSAGSSGTGASGGGAGGAGASAGAGGMGAVAGSAAGAAGSGAVAGSGGGPAGDITWDGTGWIDKGLNPFGVQGSWYSYNDCADAMAQSLPCTMPDTALLGPDSKAGWSVAPAQVCMKGTATQVMMRPDGGTIDYFGLQWGAGIAFDLNSSGGASPVMGVFNATAQGITGFRFDIVGTAPAAIRVNVVMPTTTTTAHFVEIALGTNIDVTFANCPDVLTCNIAQGSWVTAPTPFDATQIRTVQFQVFTSDAMAKPYDFCVSNFRVLH